MSQHPLDDIRAYDYALPDELIAHRPAPDRTGSMLMACQPDGTRTVAPFDSLLEHLRPGDLLVFNDTRVVPCRLSARKPTGGQVELFVLGPVEGDWASPAGPQGVTASVLTRSSKPLRQGQGLILDGLGTPVTLLEQGEGGSRVARFEGVESLLALVEAVGHIPLPPYIVKRRKELGEPEEQEDDQGRYQTVYARQPGAVAAPTAGLHFSQELLERLRGMGVELGFLTLHVGIGTFRPLGEDGMAQDHLHEEWYHIDEALAAQVRACKARGGRVVAVGTTSARALEDQGARLGDEAPRAGAFPTRLFIKHGWRWRLVDGMVTNFHLPRSSLMVLVSALAGHEIIQGAYDEAVARRLRFYSYGDAMLLWRADQEDR